MGLIGFDDFPEISLGVVHWWHIVHPAPGCGLSLWPDMACLAGVAIAVIVLNGSRSLHRRSQNLWFWCLFLVNDQCCALIFWRFCWYLDSSVFPRWWNAGKIIRSGSLSLNREHRHSTANHQASYDLQRSFCVAEPFEFNSRQSLQLKHLLANVFLGVEMKNLFSKVQEIPLGCRRWAIGALAF